LSYIIGKGIKDLDNESYSFSPKMMVFLDKELQYRRDIERSNNIKKEGKIEEYEKLLNEINNKYKNLNVERLRFLDHYIFSSMAIIIIFFEHLAKYPELRVAFETDLKELFGYITELDKKTYTKEQENSDGKIEKVPYFTIYCQENGYNNIIRRFMLSLLYWDVEKDPNNFRLGLMRDIQYVIFQYMSTIASKEFGGDIGGADHIINDDIGRAVSWTTLFGSRYSKSDQANKDKSKKPKRPILF
jgi:hypothetical protein